MERPNTLAGLLAKRAELATLLKAIRTEERKVICDLDHVDGVIRLFQPSADVSRIVRYPTRHRAKKGEVVRLCLKMLRDAAGPLTALDIVHEQIRLRNLKADDATTVIMRKRVGACLTKLRQRGVIREVPGAGFYKLWELVR